MDAQQRSVIFNARVGAMVRRYRTSANMTQTDLAEALTARGSSFQQQTVLKVEKGARPLRFEEAVHIADTFGFKVDDLLLASDEDDELAGARGQFLMAEARADQLKTAMLHLQQQLDVTKGDLGHAELLMREAQARIDNHV